MSAETNPASAAPAAPTRRLSRLGQLEARFGLPAVFALASTTVGLLSGFFTGGVTAVMTNLAETPQARPHIIRTTRIFGLAGLVHGLVGAGIIAAKGHDDYQTRAVSGCAAGLGIGMSQGKIGLACGMCLGLAGLSMVERASATILRADEYRAHSRQEKSMFAALPTKDEKWIEAWKDRINELK